MLIKTACARCSAEFEAARFSARYCSPACRTRAYRDRRKAAAASPPEAPEPVTDQAPQDVEGFPVHSALTAELTAAQQDATAMGQALLTVARRIDRDEESGSGLAALVLRLGVELQRMETAAEGAGVEDEVAKARDRRDRKRSAR
jgi:hypothetical protein